MASPSWEPKPGFATPAELTALKIIAAEAPAILVHVLAEGREQTFHKIFLPEAAMVDLLARAHIALGIRDGDVVRHFLLRYPTGNQAPKHIDTDCEKRLVLLVQAPTAGGVLRIDGVDQDMYPGDAVIFNPSKTLHSVSEVIGERLVLAVHIVSRKRDKFHL
jgi:hypothetical protein